MSVSPRSIATVVLLLMARMMTFWFGVEGTRLIPRYRRV